MKNVPMAPKRTKKNLHGLGYSSMQTAMTAQRLNYALQILFMHHKVHTQVKHMHNHYHLLTINWRKAGALKAIYRCYSPQQVSCIMGWDDPPKCYIYQTILWFLHNKLLYNVHVYLHKMLYTMERQFSILVDWYLWSSISWFLLDQHAWYSGTS